MNYYFWLGAEEDRPVTIRLPDGSRITLLKRELDAWRNAEGQTMEVALPQW